MRRVRIIHWKPAESAALVEAVRAAGFHPDYDPDPSVPAITRAIKSTLPDAVLIDLSRLPGHGREIGVWMRTNKVTRTIPIVFAGGEPGKVDKVKSALPDASYATPATIGRVLKAACANRLANPVVPAPLMDRYKNKTAAQKLGIVASSTVALMDAPRDYAAVLGDMPEGVEIFEDPLGIQNITLWFIRDSESMLAAIRTMRAVASNTKLWVIWPKGTSNKFREGSIRELGIEHGLVDYKICSVNEQWSGILFARKKA